MSAAELCSDGGVINDAVEGDLTARSFNPNDGNAIGSGAPIDINNGDVLNLKSSWQSAFKKDYGNRYCTSGNVMVVKFNSSQYTTWDATTLAGVPYSTTAVPSLHSAASGYNAKAFEVPTLETNALWEFYLVADASGSGKTPNGSVSNVTVTLYDVNFYHDQSVSPPVSICGVEDEDGNDVGSAGADTLEIYIAE